MANPFRPSPAAARALWALAWLVAALAAEAVLIHVAFAIRGGV